MNDKTEEQIFLLMTHAQDLQKAVEQQVQALEKAAQRLERDGVTAFSAAMRENVTRTLGDAKKELTEAVQAAKEASEIAKSGGRRFMRLVSVYAFFVLLLVALGLGAFSWFFVGWKAEEAAALLRGNPGKRLINRSEEAAALRAEIRAMNVDLARLPKVYDNIQGTPGVWVVIDPGAKTLQLQNGETIARLPRR